MENVIPSRHVLSLLRMRLLTGGDQGGLFAVEAGRWKRLSWTEVARFVLAITQDLEARGVASGEMVGIWATNSEMWIIMDLAIAACGAVSVMFDPEWSADRVLANMNRLRMRRIWVGSAAQLEAIRDRKPKHAMEPIACVIPSRQSQQSTDNACLDVDLPQAIHEASLKRTPNCIATVMFSSGSDGLPCAVALSHGALVNLVEAILSVYQPVGHQVSLCYLPLTHAIGRLLGVYLPLRVGANLYISKGYEHVASEIQMIRPTIFFGVPRVWEKICAALQGAGADGRKRSIQRILLACIARRLSRGQNVGQISEGVVDRILRGVLRRRIGLDRAALLLSGGARLREKVQVSLQSLGLRILEAYGQTESIVTTLSTPDMWKIGSVGKPLPGSTIRLAADGELQIRSAHLFDGYLGEPERTRFSFTDDGFFCTGDLATIDADNFVRITGRKKSLVVTSVGRKIAPEPIEHQLMEIHGVEHAILIGENRKYLTALLTPTAPFSHARDAARRKKELQATIDAHVRVLNTNRANYERIHAFKLLDLPFSIEAGELTALRKLRRGPILERYADEIESMYST
jgi:long-subunit acyl-CoA synthetase (AMP-forming)